MKRWHIAIIILLIVALATVLPLMLAKSEPTEACEASTLIKLYPVYAVATGICAWLCWPARKEIAVILMVLLVLAAAGMCLIAA